MNFPPRIASAASQSFCVVVFLSCNNIHYFADFPHMSRKENPCDTVADSSAELCSVVM